ncbi:hypothetical protein C8A05DRAFT_18683 [Staphylotrichum tortipilum]|uniref:Uncharacterized protein n=1 Tax=Staphylotrichum tortipilum TaxID=2831512 RepID=A0AAN6RQJ4_9PEZI|nr:hypothetical protein C8A05DRAFT_18683 [Staphylotrichum longicolle]
MRRLVRRLLHWGKKDEQPALLPLPSLQPVDRDAWTPDEQRQSRFFSLPAEIRHMIVCAAFGERTVHIDLRLRPRLYTVETAKGCSPSRFHAGYLSLLTRWDLTLRPGIDVRTEEDKKLAWRWYGCVCHRNRPGETAVQPFNDICLQGRGLCSDYPGNVPDKCMIGAMGYLLSCKRSYREGCLVLYQTNIVFIESTPLLDRLLRQGMSPGAPRLTGPGVQLVRALHLKVDYMLFHEWDPEREAKDRAWFLQDLNLLQRVFPRLQRLQLIFTGDMYYQCLPAPMNNVPELDTIVFAPLMEAKGKMGLKDFSVTLPIDVFLNLMKLVREWKSREIARRHIKEFKTSCGIRVWYPFGTAEDGPGQTERGFYLKSGEVGTWFWTADGSHGRVGHR